MQLLSRHLVTHPRSTLKQIVSINRKPFDFFSPSSSSSLKIEPSSRCLKAKNKKKNFLICFPCFNGIYVSNFPFFMIFLFFFLAIIIFPFKEFSTFVVSELFLFVPLLKGPQIDTNKWNGKISNVKFNLMSLLFCDPLPLPMRYFLQWKWCHKVYCFLTNFNSENRFWDWNCGDFCELRLKKYLFQQLLPLFYS